MEPEDLTATNDAEARAETGSEPIEEWRELWREASRLPDGIECLHRAAVLRSARGELDSARDRQERVRIAEHLGRCADCADAWQVARTLAPAFLPTLAPAPRRARWWWASAAAVLVLGVATFSLLPRPLDNPPVSSSRQAVASVVAVTFSPAHASQLYQPPEVLAVRSAEVPLPGTRFEIVLLDAEATLLWTSPPLETPSVDLPAELELPAGTYFWRARSLDGRPAWQSPLARFELSVP